MGRIFPVSNCGRLQRSRHRVKADESTNSPFGLFVRPNPERDSSLRCAPLRMTWRAASLKRANSPQSKSESLQVLKNPRRAHAAAHAHGDHAVAGPAPLHFPEQRGGQLGAGAAERMTEGNRAAVDVGLFLIEAGQLNYGKRLRGERFVQLRSEERRVGKGGRSRWARQR